MAKPIAVIYFPMTIEPEQFRQASKDTEKQLDDYHCIFTVHPKSIVTVEVKFAEPKDPIDIQVLQKELQEQINAIKGWQ